MDALKEFDALRDAGLTPEQSRAIVYFVQRTTGAPTTAGRQGLIRDEPTQHGLPRSVRWMQYALYGLVLSLIVAVSALLGP